MTLFKEEKICGTVSFFGIWVALLSAGSLEAKTKAASHSGKPVGTIVKLEGHAWQTRESLANVKNDLKEGSTVHDEDILVTGEKSEITVVFGHNKEAAIMIKPGSTVKVVHKNGKDWLMDLRLGGLVSQVNSMKIKPRRFQVKTGTAVMGVRGTTFFVKVEKDKDMFLCTCIGSVTIDDQLTITSKHHDEPAFIRAGSGSLKSRMVSSDMGVDHSDADAGALMKLVE